MRMRFLQNTSQPKEIMPYDLADLKSIKFEIKRKLPIMTSTSNNVDYSFSNNEKLIIHNLNFENKIPEENNEDKQGPSSETNMDASEDLIRDNRNEYGTSQDSVNINEAITEIECKQKDLKKQRDGSPENKRIIRDVSSKRSRRLKTKYASSQRRYDSSSDSSRSVPDRSPSPKRTRRESPCKKYDSDSSKFRDSSLSSSNSFLSINGQKNRSRKTRRGRSRSPRRSNSMRDSYDRLKYSRRTDESKTRRDDYERHSKRKSTRRQSEGYYDRSYQQRSANDIQERYYRYCAVMYAFTIIMDILQDDIVTTF